MATPPRRAIATRSLKQPSDTAPSLCSTPHPPMTCLPKRPQQPATDAPEAAAAAAALDSGAPIAKAAEDALSLHDYFVLQAMQPSPHLSRRGESPARHSEGWRGPGPRGLARVATAPPPPGRSACPLSVFLVKACVCVAGASCVSWSIRPGDVGILAPHSTPRAPCGATCDLYSPSPIDSECACGDPGSSCRSLSRSTSRGRRRAFTPRQNSQRPRTRPSSPLTRMRPPGRRARPTCGRRRRRPRALG